MKKLTLIVLFLLSFGAVRAQETFSDMSDVISFMDNKTFYNSELEVELQFDYIPGFNTTGIILKSNKTGKTMYFINCSVDTAYSFADVSGSALDGKYFKFRVYNKNVVIVGIGERKQYTLYIKEY